jgi:hypothetical protein
MGALHARSVVTGTDLTFFSKKLSEIPVLPACYLPARRDFLDLQVIQQQASEGAIID